MENVIEELRSYLPPIFAGTSLDDLTGNALHWRTIQNLRARKEIPPQCFVYRGPKVLIIRDPFLDWFKQSLSTEGRGFAGTPPRRKRRRDVPARPVAILDVDADAEP